MPQAVFDGALPLAMLVAALAGLVSFASPCVLPLVPGFLGYVTGLSDIDLAQRARWRMVLGATLFVLGFTVVFLTGTLFIAGIGRALIEHRLLLQRIGGVLIILMALVFLGMGGQRTWRLPIRPAAGLLGAPLLGAVFGLGWAPCIGPTLAAVMTLAAATVDPSPGRAALLGLSYSLGLGLPFILIAGAYSRWAQVSGWLRSRMRTVQVVGGILLLIVGVLLLTGVWEDINRWVQTRLVSDFEVLL
ncbi:cytochrome c biogenesis CcdA family protein [Kribbia dieselivorans]|uniref:cytochrome c biogenesis CcdA family protein n=1 Tax=Kribbia dieselivorans TaxID=331526 RepID=UPI00351E0CBB